LVGPPAGPVAQGFGRRSRALIIKLPLSK
jgi:hypothetical protein